jgi:hypothetical protein
MKHHEFYIKYKINNPPILNSVFTKRNWWLIVLITVATVLIEPMAIMYRHKKPIPFSFSYYLQLTEYLAFFVIPFVAILFWANWRELTKRSRGYCWVGKFEVVAKRTSFGFHYLLLEPGSSNRVRVNQALFEKIRIGNLIQIRRDALGSIEEVSRVSSFSRRLARARAKKSLKSHDAS